MTPVQLSVLCYLDTLLTSLVVDKMVQQRDGTDETTHKAKELSAQVGPTRHAMGTECVLT